MKLQKRKGIRREIFWPMSEVEGKKEDDKGDFWPDPGPMAFAFALWATADKSSGSG